MAKDDVTLSGSEISRMTQALQHMAGRRRQPVTRGPSVARLLRGMERDSVAPGDPGPVHQSGADGEHPKP